MGCACNVTSPTRTKTDLPLITKPIRQPINTDSYATFKSTRETEEVFPSNNSAKVLRKWRAMLGSRGVKSFDSEIGSGDSGEDGGGSVFVFALLNPRLFVKRLVDGPPSTFRWSSWKAALNISTFLIPEKYEKLKENRKKSKWLEMIRQDVGRTFCKHLINTEALENILAVYSIYNGSIGYCQGMSYIAGLLLLVSDFKEEEAFWAFVSLMEQRISFDRLPLCGINKLFTSGFPLVKLFEELFTSLLNEDLKVHLNDLGLQIDLWFHKWISSLFLYSFPVRHCIRFWDALMGNGVSFFLPLTCAILKKLTPKLLQARTMEKCNEILKLPQHIIDELFPDPEAIISTAKGLKICWKSLDHIVKKHPSCVVVKLFHKPNAEELLQLQPNDSHDSKQIIEEDEFKSNLLKSPKTRPVLS